MSAARLADGKLSARIDGAMRRFRATTDRSRVRVHDGEHRLSVDAVEVYAGLTAGQLAQIKRTWGGEVVVAAYSDVIPGWPADAPPTIETPMQRWPNSLFPQHKPVEFTSELRLGTIEDDGSVTPIAP